VLGLREVVLRVTSHKCACLRAGPAGAAQAREAPVVGSGVVPFSGYVLRIGHACVERARFYVLFVVGDRILSVLLMMR
jgi:hypothetical protein